MSGRVMGNISGASGSTSSDTRIVGGVGGDSYGSEARIFLLLVGAGAQLVVSRCQTSKLGRSAMCLFPRLT